MYPDAAPMAVYNFVGLARGAGYYDGTIIWRSQYGFAVQGGDATGTGTGGSTIWSNTPYPLEADASLKHYAGALCAAFAQGGDVTGGNSQFYFVAALPDSVKQRPTGRAGPERLHGQPGGCLRGLRAGCRTSITPTRSLARSTRAWT